MSEPGGGDGEGEASRVGQVVGGRYQIVRLLGHGGMGVVYETRHTFVGRRFAIKFLRPEYARDLDMLARFQREARAAGALESENIAAVTDFGIDVLGAPYLVMEHLAGDDLAGLLSRNGRLAATRAAGLAVQACRGLAIAHAGGIVHRDLKPGNLFVLRRADGGDLLKVIDFGIAKLRNAADDAPSKTKTGATMGTPYYMPPEQARGQRDIDHRADIYAMGAILYEMLAGTKPHPGDSYNAILFDILNRPPTPLASVRSGLPAGLAEVVERAMAFEPEQRYASAAELAEALLPYAGAALVPPDLAAASPPPAADARAFTVRTPGTSPALPAAGAEAAPSGDGAAGPGDSRSGEASVRGDSGAQAPSSVGPPARDRRRPVLFGALLLVAAGGFVFWQARLAPTPGRPARAGAETPPPAAPSVAARAVAVPPSVRPPPAAPPAAAPAEAAPAGERVAAAPVPARPRRAGARARSPAPAPKRPGIDIDIDLHNPYDSE